MKKETKITILKLRKGQKCWLCKKEIKKDWAYSGYYWCEKCKDKDSSEKIRKYLRQKKV